MTEQEIREMMQGSSDEIKTIVEQMTHLVMNVYEKGFNLGMEFAIPAKEPPMAIEPPMNFIGAVEGEVVKDMNDNLLIKSIPMSECNVAFGDKVTLFVIRK